MSSTEIIESFPPELRLPLTRLVDALKEELGVKRTDFEDLKALVRDLVHVQRQAGEQIVELAQAQKRTEERVEELAQAQKRTEERVEELAQAQKNTQDELTLFRRTFTSQIGGLGARWGLQTEEAFRQGMRAILQEVGFTTERFVAQDSGGEVFGYPEQIELDVVIQNGKVIVIEIKSSLDKANTYLFARKVAFYSRQSGKSVDRKLIVTPYADTRAKEIGMQLGIEICTDITTLQ
jgi:hypothetical protein